MTEEEVANGRSTRRHASTRAQSRPVVEMHVCHANESAVKKAFVGNGLKRGSELRRKWRNGFAISSHGIQLGNDTRRSLRSRKRVCPPCIELNRQRHSSSCCPMSQLHAIPAGRRPVVRRVPFQPSSSDADVIVACEGRDGHKTSTTRMSRCRPPTHPAKLLELVTTGRHSARNVAVTIDSSRFRGTRVIRI